MSTDPIARIVDRAFDDPTEIQVQFMDWMLEEAARLDLPKRLKGKSLDETIRLVSLIGSRSYPTFQARKNGRVQEPSGVAESATEAPTTRKAASKAASQGGAKQATAQTAPVAAEAEGVKALSTAGLRNHLITKYGYQRGELRGMDRATLLGTIQAAELDARKQEREVKAADQAAQEAAEQKISPTKAAPAKRSRKATAPKAAA